MPSRRHILFAALACALPLPTAARSSNKWRIEFSEGANSDGVIVFRVSEEQRQPIEVSAQVSDGFGENHVARTARDAFREQLPPDRFHVEIDDGEDVLVKARRGTGRFEIELLESTPRGVRINLDRE